MINNKKKISPQAIIALKDALSVIYWKRDELKEFIKLTIENTQIIGTISWDGTKRESAKELISRMTNRLDIYSDDLINLILAVSDFNDFSHLKFWDDDGSKKKRAEEAVKKLRNNTKGFIQITKEKEAAQLRRSETEKRIAKNRSLECELSELKEKFFKIAGNQNAQQRGYQLEEFLNELFTLYELDPKRSFKNYGEQIDGAFTFDSTDYLLEAKWKKQVDRSDLVTFAAKVESKLKTTVGLMVTINGITPEAITPNLNSIIIMDGLDISSIIEGRVTLPDLLYKKRRKAAESGKIYVRFDQL